MLNAPRSHDAASLPAEEQARAGLYALLSHLLLSPPPQKLLDSLAASDAMGSDLDALDAAWEGLVLAASLMDADAVREEFDALFVATGTPLVNPHESLYVGGFMMDRPLAMLRDTLRSMGLARKSGATELEDHLGSLCETMAILIGQGRSLGAQKQFFDAHLAVWVQDCTNDIRAAPCASFYRHVADLVDAFMDVERTGFELGLHVP